METKEKKDFIAINATSDRKRFSDCCNAEIINKQCPKCGRYLEEKEGMREIVIKGMDGKTTHKEPDALVSMIDDTPEKKDKMPALFKDMQNRGVKILSWSDTSV